MPQPWSACRLLGRLLLVALATSVSAAGARAEPAFPFERELLMDVAPMKGSKRVPSLEIGTNGAAEFDLWCNRVRGQLIVVGDTITILTGSRTGRQCPPDRMRGDEEVLAALAEVTNWRREGDLLILTGPRTVRFRLQTN